jgi:enamine deaminase RidA (YjgF/YER057c/UK114 family)
VAAARQQQQGEERQHHHHEHRRHVSTGTPYEATVGYSRAVRVGNIVHVAGTTAIDESGAVVGPGDAYRQASYALSKIEAALAVLGATIGDVVRTRMYVTDIGDWEGIARAHGERFADVRPAATMVEVRRLIDPAMLVEIEVEAIVDDG